MRPTGGLCKFCQSNSGKCRFVLTSRMACEANGCMQGAMGWNAGGWWGRDAFLFYLLVLTPVQHGCALSRTSPRDLLAYPEGNRRGNQFFFQPSHPQFSDNWIGDWTDLTERELICCYWWNWSVVNEITVGFFLDIYHRILLSSDDSVVFGLEEKSNQILGVKIWRFDPQRDHHQRFYWRERPKYSRDLLAYPEGNIR